MRTFLVLIFIIFRAEMALAMSTKVTMESQNFLTKPPVPVEQGELLLKAELEHRFKPTSVFSFQFHPYIEVSSLPDSRSQQVLFDPREIYGEAYFFNNFIRVGYMTLKWEGTDGVNPMDIATMKNWSDPIASQTLASAGVQIGRSADWYDVEAAWIPDQTQSTLPGVKSAWLPRRLSFPLRSDDIELKLPENIEYRYGDRRELDDASLNAYASRIQIRGDIGDAAVGFYEGMADTPILKPTLNVTPIDVTPGKQIYRLLSPAEITPIDFRVRTVSGLVSTTLGDWIFRIAARYDQPLGDHKELSSWSQATVAGVERTFLIGSNALTGVLQWSMVHHPEGVGLLSIADIFDKSVLYGLRVPMGESWLVFVSGFYSTIDQSTYEKIEIGYRFNDHWRIDAGVELIDGPGESLLGIYGQNDRATIAVSAFF